MQASELVAAALIGAALGAMTLAVLTLPRRLNGHGSGFGPRVLLVGTVITVALFFVVTRFTGAVPLVASLISPPSESEAVGQRLMALPQVQAQTRGKSPAEVQTLIARMSSAGLPRLDSADLVTRAKVLSKIMQSVDEPTCAGIATGVAPPEILAQLLDKLPAGDRAAWFTISERAVEASVGARPPTTEPPLTEEQVLAAMTALRETIPEAERATFDEHMGRLAELPQAEACATIRTLFTLVSAASGTTQAVAARMLVMQ
jgi:hypothetical protein